LHSQGAIYLQSRSQGTPTRVYLNKISEVRWGTPDKVSDGCAIYAETGSSDVEVFRNAVWDARVAFQDNSGRKTKWWSNLVYDCATAMRVSDQFGNNAMDHEFFNNTCIVGKNLSYPLNNSFQDRGHRTYKPSGVITSLKVYNNVFWNTGAESSAAISTPQVTPAASLYSNNAVSTGYLNVAKREYSSTVESTPGSITGGFELSSFQLKPGSPLISAGSPVQVCDYNGRQFLASPSVGAFQYAPLRIQASVRQLRY